MAKLYRYGKRGGTFEWFKSYLYNRKQYVNVNNCHSDEKNITHGVPQGSILGPLLFLLFINDFPNCNNFFKFTLFADDSNLFCRLKKTSCSDIQNIISSNLVHVDNWLTANKIKINIDKSKFMIFSYQSPMRIDLIKFGSGTIASTSTIKFLGVTIDQNLNFKEHVTKLKTNICKQVGLLYRLNKFIPLKILKIIYNTIVLPHLNYGIIVWYSAPSFIIQRIFVSQKKFIRAICGLEYNQTTRPHFKDLNLLKLSEIYKRNLLLHFYDTIFEDMNPNLQNIIESHSAFHNYNTRIKSNLVLPQVNRTKTRLNFYC